MDDWVETEQRYRKGFIDGANWALATESSAISALNELLGWIKQAQIWVASEEYTVDDSFNLIIDSANSIRSQLHKSRININ